METEAKQMRFLSVNVKRYDMVNGRQVPHEPRAVLNVATARGSHRPIELDLATAARLSAQSAEAVAALLNESSRG